MRITLPARKMLQLMAITTAVMVVVGIILCLVLESLTAIDILYVSLGILFTSSLNAAKVFLLEMQVKKLSKMEDPKRARGYAMLQGFLRYVLTFGGLALVGWLVYKRFIPSVTLYAAIAGAFTWLISVYLLKFIKFETDEME